jgi:hypothetical protein
MRKLVLLVCMSVSAGSAFAGAGIIPTLESHSKTFGLYPITNEVTLYKSVDDSGKDRGQTIQIVSINTVKLWTEFNFEFTGDYNFSYTAGLSHDHYIEVGIVKPVTKFVSLNVQRVISTFEARGITQYGIRFGF